MNRADLVVLIAQKMECSQTYSIKFMNAFCESMLEALERDDKVQISGLGTFSSTPALEEDVSSRRMGKCKCHLSEWFPLRQATN